MSYVNDDIDLEMRRLADAIRESTMRDPVSRLGLTSDVREAVTALLDEIEHAAIIELYERVGYARAREHVPWRRLSAAVEHEESLNPAFMRSGARAKAHLPNPGTAVHFRPRTAG